MGEVLERRSFLRRLGLGVVSVSPAMGLDLSAPGRDCECGYTSPPDAVYCAKCGCKVGGASGSEIWQPKPELLAIHSLRPLRIGDYVSIPIAIGPDPAPVLDVHGLLDACQIRADPGTVDVGNERELPCLSLAWRIDFSILLSGGLS